MGAVEHVDKHRIDPESGRVEPFDRHVGGGISQVAAALLAAEDGPVDPVPVPEHRRGVARAPGREGLPDGGRGHLAARAPEQFGNGDPEAHLGSEGAKIPGIAGTPLAEAEIGPDDDVAQPEPVADDIPGEFPRAERRERGVEVQLVKPFDPSFSSLWARASRPIRRNGGASGAKNSRGCGSKVSTPSGAPCRGARPAGRVDHRLVADMHAVEVADGDAGAAVGRVEIGVVADDAHGGWVASCADRRKRDAPTLRPDAARASR